jgi:hypothetical protein
MLGGQAAPATTDLDINPILQAMRQQRASAQAAPAQAAPQLPQGVVGAGPMIGMGGPGIFNGDRNESRGFNPYGGPGLGQDVFSQGMATLGKLPSRDQVAFNYLGGLGGSAGEMLRLSDPATYAKLLMAGRGAGDKAYNDMLDQYRLGSEGMAKNQLGAADLGLRQQLGMGQLGVQQQAENRLGAESRYKLSPAGRIDALINQWNVDPTKAPPALDQESRIRSILGIEAQVPGREPLQSPPMGGAKLPSGAAPSQGAAVYPGSLGGEPAPWAGIEKMLEQVKYSGQKKDDKGNALPPTIGEFLQSLDTAHPGMIRENPDAVMGWIRNQKDFGGEKGFQDWFQGTNYKRSALSPLIGMSPQHTTDEKMRAALQGLMAERGNPVQTKMSGLAGGIESVLKPLGQGLDALSGGRLSKLVNGQ